MYVHISIHIYTHICVYMYWLINMIFQDMKMQMFACYLQACLFFLSLLLFTYVYLYTLYICFVTLIS